jgi:hypothetical protein
MFIYVSVRWTLCTRRDLTLPLQVNGRDGWDDLLETFGLPASTTNGSLSLKQAYLR